MKRQSSMIPWMVPKCLILVMAITGAAPLNLRQGRAITWQDILQGKSGYPSITLQGYRNRIPTQSKVSTTTETPTLPTTMIPTTARETTTTSTTARATMPTTARTTMPTTARTTMPTTPAHTTPRSTTILDIKRPYIVTSATLAAPEYGTEKPIFTSPVPESDNKHSFINKDRYSKFISSSKGSFKDSKSELNNERPTKDIVIKDYISQGINDNVYSNVNSAKNIPGEYKFDDYSDEFFENNYYEYVDEDNKNDMDDMEENKNVLEDVHSNKTDATVTQTADRRALDFLYHMFVDPSRTEKKDKGPYLIQEIFETIDRHIINDIQDWTNHDRGNTNKILSPFFQTLNQQPTAASPTLFLPPIVGSAPGTKPQNVQKPTLEYLSPSQTNPVGSGSQVVNSQSISTGLGISGPTNSVSSNQGFQIPLANSISPNFSGDKFLVTDEVGQQYRVSIDDIITSLAQLEEAELVNLLVPSANTQGNSPTSIGIPLGSSSAQPNIERPTRQIDNAIFPAANEVFLIKNKAGDVQLVSIDDILEKLQTLKTKETIPSQPTKDDTSFITQDVLAQLLNNLDQSEAINNDNVNELLAQEQYRKAQTISNKVSSSPIVSTDKNGNIYLKLANDGQSSILDLSNGHFSAQSTEQRNNIPGNSVVKTDNNGNVHIYPNPDEPFKLDIQKIISLAENAQQKYQIREILPKPTTTTQRPQTGEDILDFLIGGADNLPRPIRASSPLQSNTKETPNVPWQTIPTNQEKIPVPGDDEYYLKLLNTVGIQPANDRYNNFNSKSPVIVPPTQFAQQSHFHVPPPTNVQHTQQRPGITDTLRSLFSRLIGNDRSVNHESNNNSPTRVHQDRDEVVTLVVREQDRGSNEHILGHVNIKLPKPIHYEDESRLKPVYSPSNVDANRRTLDLNPPETSQRHPTISTPNLGAIFTNQKIPNQVQQYILAQLNNKPRFDIQKQAKETQRRSDHYVAPDHHSGSGQYSAPNHYSVPDPHESSYTYIYDEPKHSPVPYAPAPIPNNDYPLFTLNFLADLVKVKKIGKDNKSVHLPKVGDSSRFVDTRKYHYYRR